MDEVGVKEKTEQMKSQSKEKDSWWKRLFGINGRNGRNGTAEENINELLKWPEKKEQKHAEIGSKHRDKIGEELKSRDYSPPNESKYSNNGTSMTPSAEGTGKTPFTFGIQQGTMPGAVRGPQEDTGKMMKERQSRKLKRRQTKPEGSTG